MKKKSLKKYNCSAKKGEKMESYRMLSKKKNHKRQEESERSHLLVPFGVTLLGPQKLTDGVGCAPWGHELRRGMLMLLGSAVPKTGPAPSLGKCLISLLRDVGKASKWIFAQLQGGP